LLFRNGRCERVAEPGRHRLLDPQQVLTIETFPVVRVEFPATCTPARARVSMRC
jgi:hypothetical protein